MSEKRNEHEYVKGLVERARKAQAVADTYSQEQVDRLSRAVGWALVQEETVERIAKFCLEETRMVRRHRGCWR